MLPLAIWLFLIGYTIAIAGKRNLGVQYVPQADGSIKPVDQQGNPAKTYSLMAVITCGEPEPAAGGQPAGQPSSALGMTQQLVPRPAPAPAALPSVKPDLTKLVPLPGRVLIPIVRSGGGAGIMNNAVRGARMSACSWFGVWC